MVTLHTLRTIALALGSGCSLWAVGGGAEPVGIFLLPGWHGPESGPRVTALLRSSFPMSASQRAMRKCPAPSEHPGEWGGWASGRPGHTSISSTMSRLPVGGQSWSVRVVGKGQLGPGLQRHPVSPRWAVRSPLHAWRVGMLGMRRAQGHR